MQPLKLSAKDMMSHFSLKGRMRRRHYLMVVICAFIALQLLAHLQDFVKLDLSIGALLIRLALIPPTVRRLHDMGYSGWFTIAVIAIPYVSLLLLFIPPDAGTEFGPDPRKTEADKASPLPTAPTNPPMA